MEYYGKKKCRILKEIRAEIAKANDIEWVVEECKHKGNCKGTCPKCEAEVVRLEKELARREAVGKAVAVVGVSAALSLSVTGCVNPVAAPTGDPVPVYDSREIAEQTDTVTETETDPEAVPMMGVEVPDYDSREIAEQTDTVTETETETETDPEADPLMGDPVPESYTEMGVPPEGEMPEDGQ